MEDKDIDYDLFENTIEERIILVSDLGEEIRYLSYHINPIGLFDNLKVSMFKNGLEQIEIIELKLKELKQSYINCIKI